MDAIPEVSRSSNLLPLVPDPGKTEKQNQKALERFAVEFEAKVKAGKYLDGEN